MIRFEQSPQLKGFIGETKESVLQSANECLNDLGDRVAHVEVLRFGRPTPSLWVEENQYNLDLMVTLYSEIGWDGKELKLI